MHWRYKIELNAAIADANEKHDLSRVEEPCPADVLESFAVEVEKALPLFHFGAMFRSATTIAGANRILESVFDRADREAVWCGMPFRDKSGTPAKLVRKE